MADTLSIDYSFARPNPADIRAAGYTGVWRYAGGTANKDLTTGEAASLHAAGLGVGVVFESTAQRSLYGTEGGTADGQAAAALARSVGLPAGAPLLVAVADFQATVLQLPAILAYYRAFRGQTGPWQGGGYGTAYVIGSLAAAGEDGLWWQSAEDDEGVPGDIVSPHASVYQRVQPTHAIAGSSPADFDEDVEGFGPAAVNWWTGPGTVTPGTAPAPLPRGGIAYVVRAGDTLSGIAARFGVALAALEAANPQVKNPDLIYPGQVLRVPGTSTARTYMVQPGDTMSGIALRFSVSLQSLEAANPQVTDPGLIYPGWVLRIP